MSASNDKTLRLWNGDDHWNAAEEAILENEEAELREKSNGVATASSSGIRQGTYDSLNESDEGSHSGSITALAASKSQGCETHAANQTP